MALKGLRFPKVRLALSLSLPGEQNCYTSQSAVRCSGRRGLRGHPPRLLAPGAICVTDGLLRAPLLVQTRWQCLSPTRSARTCLPRLLAARRGPPLGPGRCPDPTCPALVEAPFQSHHLTGIEPSSRDIQVDPEEVRTDRSLVVGVRSPQLCTPEVTRAS